MSDTGYSSYEESWEEYSVRRFIVALRRLKHNEVTLRDRPGLRFAFYACDFVFPKHHGLVFDFIHGNLVIDAFVCCFSTLLHNGAPFSLGPPIQ